MGNLRRKSLLLLFCTKEKLPWSKIPRKIIDFSQASHPLGLRSHAQQNCFTREPVHLAGGRPHGQAIGFPEHVVQTLPLERPLPSQISRTVIWFKSKPNVPTPRTLQELVKGGSLNLTSQKKKKKGKPNPAFKAIQAKLQREELGIWEPIIALQKHKIKSV